MGLRFGFRLGFGPFSVSASTSTRRRRRRRATAAGISRAREAQAEAAAAAHKAKLASIEQRQRIARMSPREYAESIGADWDACQDQRQATSAAARARVEAELQMMKDESRGDA